jgi:hypothetical protein
VLVAGSVLVALAPIGLAQPADLPDAIGSRGRAAGQSVSDEARNAPESRAAAESTAASSRDGGMPALAGLSGEAFGAKVSALARSGPGEVADYFRTLRSSNAASTAAKRRGNGAGVRTDPPGRSRPLPDAATQRRGAGQP